jgi:dTDP-4-amino-4,6-dideoxygalactose transaminase
VSSCPEASPVLIPYGRKCIDEADIRGVADILRSDFLTTGPKVAEFEEAFEGLLSLPMFPGLGKTDQECVVAALSESMSTHRGE